MSRYRPVPTTPTRSHEGLVEFGKEGSFGPVLWEPDDSDLVTNRSPLQTRIRDKQGVRRGPPGQISKPSNRLPSRRAHREHSSDVTLNSSTRAGTTSSPATSLTTSPSRGYTLWVHGQSFGCWVASCPTEDLLDAGSGCR